MWNRTRERCEPLRAAGAEIAADPGEVFGRAGVVFLLDAGPMASAVSRMKSPELLPVTSTSRRAPRTY